MPTDIRLAIVGSRRYADDRQAAARARHTITGALSHYDPAVVISGGARGIDQLAAELARSAGIDVVEHLPEHRRWTPDGYRERNLAIVDDCSHLLAIIHPDATSYGAGWTADRAVEAGKTVHRRHC